MKITKDVAADARRLMKLCLSDEGELQEDAMRQVIATIVEKKPRNYLALLHALRQLLVLHEKKHSACICSAVPMTEAQQDEIRQKLLSRHSQLSFDWRVDPALIAGFTVQIGDKLHDASVQSRIQRLAQL